MGYISISYGCELVNERFKSKRGETKSAVYIKVGAGAHWSIKLTCGAIKNLREVCPGSDSAHGPREHVGNKVTTLHKLDVCCRIMSSFAQIWINKVVVLILKIDFLNLYIILSKETSNTHSHTHTTCVLWYFLRRHWLHREQRRPADSCGIAPHLNRCIKLALSFRQIDYWWRG